MTQDTRPPRTSKRFLFDENNFDTPSGTETIAPVYSQEELAAARQSAYAQGKNDGIAEAQNSFEKHTSDILMAVRDHFSILFDEEDRRSRMFEKEGAQLAYTVFLRAFPALNERFGLLEVKSTVANVLETVRELPEIIVEVPQAYVSVIQNHIDHLLRRDGGPRCTVRGSDQLAAGQCKMMWTNGHAMRNGTKLAEQIRTQIEQVLADKAILTDNGEETVAVTPPGEE